MGIYYDAKEIVRRGTKIISYRKNERPPVREGEALVAVVNNGLWAIAPDVTDTIEFRDFYESYEKGNWLKMDIYALPKSELPNCKDKGRVELRELEKILKEHPPKTENRF